MTSAPVDVHVAANGNGFMRDIAEWLVDAARRSGRSARLVDDRLPDPSTGAIPLVVAPHEYFELTEASPGELQRAAAGSIAVCTEQPGTPWFHLSVDACRRGLLSLDISTHGVAALRDVGVDTCLLRLGSTPAMISAAANAPAEHRPIDVLFMGGLDDRRGALLATLGPELWHRRADLRVFRFERPATATTPGVVFGTAKYDLLASAKVLVNLHRDRSAHLPAGAPAAAYFEWARLVETIANGCAVVTEPGDDHLPLIPGTHFLEAEATTLAETVRDLLDDPERRDRLAETARAAVSGDAALAASLAPVLDRIEHDLLARLTDHAATSRPERGLWRFGSSRVAPPRRLGVFRPYAEVQRTAKRLALADASLLRRLDRVASTLHHGDERHVTVHTTSAWAAARPEVSVVVSLYDYSDVVRETLDSICASSDVEFEVIVVEDHATDDSRRVVLDALDARPDVAMMLIAKDVNEGLAAARNDGFAAARAEFVMVMDADNLVYPTCLRRLADALNDDPGAAAAYAILEDFGARRDIRSALAWDVERLCRANYIDAQAMLRRSAWSDLGGYRGDDDVFGWEDWDLWLRLARSGGHAVGVREILGRYRVQPSSMISLTNLATDTAIDAIRRRYPELPWPTTPAA
jgi:hypothetical protein